MSLLFFNWCVTGTKSLPATIANCLRDNWEYVKRGTLILLALCRCAFALNPSLDINQYAHNAWTIRDDFFKGVIMSIAQTPDGYLWLGTEFGLLRFDGVRSVPWQPPADEHLPGSEIRALLVPRNGSLWIGTNEGLASWKDGKLTHYPQLAGKTVESLLEDREGMVWAGVSADPNGGLCAIKNGITHCYGEDGSFGRQVLSLYEDSRGNLWAGAQTGLWRWKPGAPKLFPMPGVDIYGISEGDHGELLFSMDTGIKQLVGGRAEPDPLPNNKWQFRPYKLLRDRSGSLWIETADHGLVHVHQGRTDLFAQSDGLSGDLVYRVFEDREGNTWVSTDNGLDRFHDVAVPTSSVKQGISNSVVLSVLAARDGSVWLGTADGLNRWTNGRITVYRKPNGLPDDLIESLFQDYSGRIWVSTHGGVAWFEHGRFTPISTVPAEAVHSIAGDNAGNLWIADQYQGLFHLFEGSVVERIAWARLGRKDYAIALLADPVKGGLWLGYSQGGVAYFKDSHVRASYSSADGLGAGSVNSLQLDRDGALWVGADRGLSRIKNVHIATLTSKNGLPCDAVHGVVEDDEHSVWLYLACGLVRLNRTELDAWVTDPKRTIQTTVFDSADGFRTHSIAGAYTPHVAKSRDGKLWSAPWNGASVIDPRHLPFNKFPPPVHIEQITADRKIRWQNLWGAAASNLRLPALSRELEIDYTALTLVAPEKIRFKCKLEGYDRDWQDVGNRRQVFYNDLPPRNYRFRVIASNNSGVWNEAGDSLAFSIDPAYYQTAWFRALIAAVILTVFWGLHRLRLHQMVREFTARLDGRVDERMRVARELHDTLLQGFQGSLFQMQAARNLFPRRPEKAVETLDEAINMAEGAITEGRDAIQDLRSQPPFQSDLAQLLKVTGQELARSHATNGNLVMFRVRVEGERRDLDPLLQDEAYRIARELLRNAFQHAHASQIEAEIRYEPRQLRVRVRDDGVGIDASVLSAGRAGHWGLPGMRERAKAIGAQLEIWSERGAGAEVELAIPASVAYGTHASRRFRLLKRKAETTS